MIKELEVNKSFREIIRKIAKIILTNQQKIIREEDLKNLCDKSLDFSQIMIEVYNSLVNVGFELISTNFLDQKYYVLTSEGKDDRINPSNFEKYNPKPAIKEFIKYFRYPRVKKLKLRLKN